MTNQIELFTNTVSVSTHLTPQQASWEFKQWAGVIGMICTSIYAAIHLVLPKVQAFVDARDGGWAQAVFYKLFGKPISGPKPPPVAAENKQIASV